MTILVGKFAVLFKGIITGIITDMLIGILFELQKN